LKSTKNSEIEKENTKNQKSSFTGDHVVPPGIWQKMAAMCDEMAVIYEDGADNGLESVVERLAEERDRIQGELNQR